ncbi:MAG: hypothetical protein LBD29_00130 [Treponema sp.]|jgi:hypothetical protein|nr:hypothetical protein [Treponema sp.]
MKQKLHEKTLIYIGGILIVFFTGCNSTPLEGYIDWQPPPPEAEEAILYRIADYKTQALGQELPSWVIRYDSGDLRQIEYLPEYEGCYVFIGKRTGTNFKALQQWNSGFRVTHDFARLVALRIQERFTKEALTFPDQEYGAFFEAVIKAAYDAAFIGSIQEDDFWVKKQYLNEDGVTIEQEIYEFLILVTIDKETLERQIDSILNTIAVPRDLTKEQTARVLQIKTVFFDGF